MPLISPRQLLDHATERGYGMPAFNISNMEQGRAIMNAARAYDALVHDRFERFATVGYGHAIKSIALAGMPRRYQEGALDPRVAA